MSASAYLDTAERLADLAAEVVRPFFRRPIQIDRKPDASPVTEADRAVEQAIRATLADLHPDHGVIGEEFASLRPDAEWVWVIDPIDGTGAFISGQPTFGTLIALLHNGEPALGIIDQPIAGERWLGNGTETRFNDQVVHTSACEAVKEASLFATTPHQFHGSDASGFAVLQARARMTRFGIDCYAYGLLALGFVDAVVEASLSPYDYLALVPVVEGAGGRITDWGGNALNLVSDGRVVAAGSAPLQEEILSLLDASQGGAER